MNLYTLLKLVTRSREVLQAGFAMREQNILSTGQHLRLCAEWLLYSQNIHKEGGYAAWYGLVTGLRSAYIETTGYIIPTMFDLATFFGESKFRNSAIKAGEWLLRVQQSDGSFTDIDNYDPQVFDTGQVLLGLNRLFRETADTRYLIAGRRAGDWLVKVQDADGGWTSMAYHRGRSSTYHSRVAAAILELSQLSGEKKYQDCAVKNLRWTAGFQQPNGFFLYSELIPGEDPVLHTMCYVLEGFLMAYKLTNEQEWLDALLRGAQPLKRLHLERDLVLRSQYNADLNVTNREKCLPGLAQWAIVCLHLCKITQDPSWLESAQLSIYYLKSKQLQGNGILHGALPASVPLWGYYHPMTFPNWGVKFFADALLLYEKHKLEVWQEQETWVRKCFELQLDGGGWKAHSTQLGSFDLIICGMIRDQLTGKGSNSVYALDIGCGEGRFFKPLQELLPSLNIIGVDPTASGENPNIYRGSINNIPFSNETFDMVYVILTLQHVADLPLAFRELHRVLKPGGLLIICDRDAWSGRGLLKPYHELKGLWMYPWDSPFRERWYSLAQWRKHLLRAGFNLLSSIRLSNPEEKGWRKLVRMNGFIFLAAVKGK